MVLVPSKDFINRVVLSDERVLFSFVDPFGHLNTSRYVEMFVNHRILAPDEQAGISTMALHKDLKISMVFHEVQAKFLVPALLGEHLHIASWVASIHETGFAIRGVIFGAKDSRVKATLGADLRSVSAETGRPVPLPKEVPCREGGLLEKLPQKDEYLKGIKGVPKEF